MEQKKKLVRKKSSGAAVQKDEALRKEDETKDEKEDETKAKKMHPGKYPSDHHEEITDPYHNFCKVAVHIRKLSQTGEK